MPRVLIVEDEPAAARYLRSLIELKCPEFSVVGISGNGKEALDEIHRSKPDLVLTDARMPVMDGLEFVARLKDDFPQLPVVIVSGHKDFEYARRALDTGVVDYLLKPIDPERLVEVLSRLGLLLSEREAARRAEELLRFIKGDPCGTGLPVDPEAVFRLAVVRSGGLPSRYLLDRRSDERIVCEEAFYDFPGRDSRERICLGIRRQLGSEAFTVLASASASSLVTMALAAGAPAFTTILVWPDFPCGRALNDAVRDACLALDKLIVAGQSRIHFAPAAQSQEIAWDRTFADRLEFALRESRRDLLEAAMHDLSDSWQARGSPLVAVESQLRRILHFVLREAPHADSSVAANLELLLEKALAGVRNFEELSDSAWALVSKAAGADDPDWRKSDIPAFFNAIMRFVEARYSESITLGELSDRFRISPSYLSKLFRQHGGRSFGESLASIRIEAAKRLIRENPEMPLKDIADKVGYKDPFYFSRVFKSLVGLPPSDFSRSEKAGLPLASAVPDASAVPENPFP